MKKVTRELLGIHENLSEEGKLFRDGMEKLLLLVGCRTPVAMAFLFHLVYDNFHRMPELIESMEMRKFYDAVTAEHLYRKMD